MNRPFIPAFAGFGPAGRPVPPFRRGAALHNDTDGEHEHRHGRRGRRGPGGPGGPGGRGFGFGPGFGGPGFGAGGPGFGPGGPGFGPGLRGRRGRRQRGNVRAAVLALLAEEPQHGYAVMNELAERSGGLWRPSPGSVYPVLSQLQDEGLVTVSDAEGRRVFALTDAGRAYVESHADELREPWVVADSGPIERVHRLMASMAGLGAAVEQVARLGDEAQTERAVRALDDARKAMYRILAGDEPAPGTVTHPDDESRPPAAPQA